MPTAKWWRDLWADSSHSATRPMIQAWGTTAIRLLHWCVHTLNAISTVVVAHLTQNAARVAVVMSLVLRTTRSSVAAHP
jgi:hypothetical protein